MTGIEINWPLELPELGIKKGPQLIRVMLSVAKADYPGLCEILCSSCGGKGGCIRCLAHGGFPRCLGGQCKLTQTPFAHQSKLWDGFNHWLPPHQMARMMRQRRRTPQLVRKLPRTIPKTTWKNPQHQLGGRHNHSHITTQLFSGLRPSPTLHGVTAIFLKLLSNFSVDCGPEMIVVTT